jgi:hypothetical protein
MKLKCECGQEFEVPDGASGADCPACGRKVSAGRGDWLSALDVEDLELDATQEAAVPPEAAPAPSRPAPSATTPSAAAKAPVGARAPGAGRPAVPGPQPAARRKAATAEPQVAEPRGLLGLLALVGNEPFALLSLLRRGLRGTRLVAEMGIATLVLALVWSFVSANLAGNPGIGPAAVRFAQIVVELLYAGVLLALLTYLLKRGKEDCPHPLGVAEAILLTRLIALMVAVPVGIVVVVVVGSPHIAAAAAQGAAAVGTAAAPSHMVQDLARWLYFIVAFGAQTGYVMGLLNLGCLPGVVVSAIISYSAGALFG